jgi:peptide/nickel transport system substrate-binding protein
MSIHEEAKSGQNRMMAVFNNLVLFKQDMAQNRMDTIGLDLATKWSNAGMTELTFLLRRGSVGMMTNPSLRRMSNAPGPDPGQRYRKARANPRKAWYRNLNRSAPKAKQSPSI